MVRVGRGSGAEGGAGPDLVRQMARDLAEDDVVAPHSSPGGKPARARRRAARERAAAMES